MPVARTYLDSNASLPLRSCARDACMAALDLPGNASSVHAEGRLARRAIEDARRHVAALVGAEAGQVIFTSGATESANMVLTPDLGTSRGGRSHRLLVSATEHAAVRMGHRFAADRVTVVPVDGNGLVDLNRLTTMLRAVDGPAMLALQAANNETGVLQPVREAADLVHAAGGVLVCDATQALGRVPFDLRTSGADAVLLSSHKIGGPKGAGAVVFAETVRFGGALVRGGGQERGFRSGTENVPAIAGFGAAAADVLGCPEAAALLNLRTRLEAGLRALVGDVVILGADAPRLPNTTLFAIPDVSAETLLMALDLDGFAVSSGSACSSGKVSRSAVLEAMAVDPHVSRGAVRVSFGWFSTETDVDRFLTCLGRILNRFSGRVLSAAA